MKKKITTDMENDFLKNDDLAESYDFSNANPNPYYDKLKQQVTIRLNVKALDYFKSEGKRLGIPYQTLINIYLMDCANQNKKLIVG